MKLLVDEDVSGVVVDTLAALGIDVEWIKRTNRGISDGEIVRLAQEKGRTILTADKGFGERVFRRRYRVSVILSGSTRCLLTSTWRVSWTSLPAVLTGMNSSA